MHCAGLRTDHWYLLLIFDFSNTSPRFLFVTCVFWLISSFLKSSAATEKFFPLVISLWVEHVRGFVLPRSSTNKIMHETGLQEITIIIIMLTTSHKVISEQSQQLDFLSLQEFSRLRLLSQVLIHDSWALPFFFAMLDQTCPRFYLFVEKLHNWNYNQ